MFFQESESLQTEKTQYSSQIDHIDTFLYNLDFGEHKHLDVEMVSTLLDIDERITETIFQGYCSKGLLEEKFFFVCPREEKIIQEIQSDTTFPVVVYCELCEKEHTLYQKHTVKRYNTLNLVQVQAAKKILY